MSPRTVVSSPGKVLVTGGYLVLERPNAGLVLPTDARFFSAVSTAEASDTYSAEPSTSSSSWLVSVASPQFRMVTRFRVTVPSDDKQQVDVKPWDADGPRNPYLQNTLAAALAVARYRLSAADFESKLGRELQIVIVADNDFYSQREELKRRGMQVTSAALASLPRFCPPGTTLEGVSKTGLGSSAALITSLSAAILAHFGVIHLPQSNTVVESQNSSTDDYTHDLKLAHNVAQLAHCAAQGKIGSGFDVSAAVWGAHRYVRFSPNILEPLMSYSSVSGSKFSAKDFISGLDPSSSDNQWNEVVNPFFLPPFMQLFLGDISSGSSTPKMVSKIMEWKSKEAESAVKLWNELAAWNDRVEASLRRLTELSLEQKDVYQATLASASEKNLDQWNDSNDVAKELREARSHFLNVRACLRKMGEQADVPVEPPSQTELLDACMAIPGVLLAGVPGAGGFDAIFCILMNPTAKERVEDLWARWQGGGIVCPLLSGCSTQGLAMHQDQEVSIPAFGP